jgi:uncharacterized protein with HEPN domain
MQPKSFKLLDDILDAATFILKVAHGKSLDDYRSDRLLRQAIERNFEIIGEAVNRLMRVDPDTAASIEHASVIVAFRNVLAHGYDIVEVERIWQTIVEDVSVLQRQVEALLQDGGAV